MRDFDLQKSYIVILCLFSSIGYFKKLENVVKTLACFKRHLNSGGIILIESWFTRDVWQVDGSIHMLFAENEDIKVCRVHVSGRDGDISIPNLHFLVGAAGKIEYFTEQHDLGLSTVGQISFAFEAAKLSVRHDQEGITVQWLYIARISH